MALKNRSLFVATSKPIPFAEKILRHFDLHAHFARIYGSELNGERSDKTELIAYVIRHERLDPRSTVMVGDREHDLIGARNNNIAAVGAAWGYGSEAELSAGGARHVIRSPLQLVDIVLSEQAEIHHSSDWNNRFSDFEMDAWP